MLILILCLVACNKLSCNCGYTRDKHESLRETSANDSQGQSAWTVDLHTKTRPTDAFGEVHFAGSTMTARKVVYLIQFDSEVLHDVHNEKTIDKYAICLEACVNL